MARNVKVTRGATKRITMKCYETSNRTGPVLDLTGATVTVIQTSDNLPKPNVAIVQPGSIGQVTVIWTSDKTSKFKPGNAAYWVRIALDFPSTDREVVIVYCDVE